MSYQVPSVVKRHGGRIAIITGKGRKNFDVIANESGRLFSRKYTCEELQMLGYAHDPYPVVSAAEKFLTHQGGLTPNARTSLEQLIEDAWLL